MSAEAGPPPPLPLPAPLAAGAAAAPTAAPAAGAQPTATAPVAAAAAAAVGKLLKKTLQFYPNDTAPDPTSAAGDGEVPAAGLTWLALNRPMRPVLQDGPMCGLVALSMACEQLVPAGDAAALARTNVLEVLRVAQDKGFTSQGEMFSADFVAALATECCGVRAETVAYEDASILRHLLRGGYALVPYDAAPNHEPCTRNGDKAHWAAVRGFLIQVDGAAAEAAVSSGPWSRVKAAPPRQPQFFLHDTAGATPATVAAVPSSPASLFWLCQQGKSKHEASWPSKWLAESNANLHKAGEHRAEDGMVIPNPDDLADLRGKVVLLSRPQSADPPH